MKRTVSKRRAKVENKLIWTIVIVIVLVIGLALYGYFTGAWDKAPCGYQVNGC